MIATSNHCLDDRGYKIIMCSQTGTGVTSMYLNLQRTTGIGSIPRGGQECRWLTAIKSASSVSSRKQNDEKPAIGPSLPAVDPFLKLHLNVTDIA